MRRSLPVLLLIALLAVACGGEGDTATSDTATSDVATTPDAATADSTTAAATDGATDASGTTSGAEDSVVCFGLQAVLDGYDDFLQADPDSDQQREAVELIGQFGREVADAVGADSPELESALDQLHEHAAAIVSEGQSTAEEADIDEALQTVGEAQADCANLG